MEVFQTKVSTSSEAYKQNAEVQKSHLEKLNQSLEKVRLGGGEVYVSRHHERGKKLAENELK